MALMTNGDNIEMCLNQSRPNRGYTVASTLRLRNGWYTYDGGEGSVSSMALPTTNAIGLGRPNLGSFGQAVVWQGTAGDSSTAEGGQVEVEVPIDYQFAKHLPALQFIIEAGKSGSGTNNTLALVVEFYARQAAAEPVVVATDSLLLSTKVAGGNFADLDLYTFDVGKIAKSSDTWKYITPGLGGFLRIAPSEAAGTNVVLTVMDEVQMLFNSHASLGPGKTRLTR